MKNLFLDTGHTSLKQSHRCNQARAGNNGLVYERKLIVLRCTKNILIEKLKTSSANNLNDCQAWKCAITKPLEAIDCAFRYF